MAEGAQTRVALPGGGERELPPRPREPLDSDCCGTGCTPCVLDLHDQEIKLWEEECDRILHGDADLTSQGDVISPASYTKFELTEISQVSPDSFSYKFLIPNKQRLPIKTGQHLLLRCAGITRQYTPVSDFSSRGHFQFVIKLYEDGEMSKHIKLWRVGDQIDWRGPLGTFTYSPNQYKRVVMLAAGTGVAPMIQVIRCILGNPEDETRVHLVSAYRTYPDILCKQQIDAWRDFWNFQCTYFLSQECEESVKKQKRYGEGVVSERLTEDNLEALMGDVKNTRVLISGTKSFDKDMLNFLHRLGTPETDIHKF